MSYTKPKPHKNSPGEYLITVDHAQEVVRLVLYNFDIGGPRLKKEHTDILDRAIAPVIKDGGSIALIGLASTTGSLKRDEVLGERRAQEVQHYLLQNSGAHFHVSKLKSWGKIMALAFEEKGLKGGTKDNTESDLWRAVWINAWNRGLPPPPSLDSKDSDPFNNPNWSEDAGKFLDRASWGLGFIDFAADIAEYAGIASNAIPGADLFVAVVDTMAALPMAWGSGDWYAEQNGKYRGRADAIQDMADQFKDDGKIEKLPYKDYPAVKAPTPHLTVIPQPSAGEIFAQQGQREGCIDATKMIVELENNPKSMTSPSGKNFRLTGRIWLRIMSKAFGDNVGIKVVIDPLNENLKKQGKPPFPLRP